MLLPYSILTKDALNMIHSLIELKESAAPVQVSETLAPGSMVTYAGGRGKVVSIANGKANIQVFAGPKATDKRVTKPLASVTLDDKVKMQPKVGAKPKKLPEAAYTEIVGKAITEALRLADSQNAKMRVLQDAVRAKFPTSGYDCGYPYIADCYDDVVIVRQGDDLFQIPYTLTQDGDDWAAELGDATEVEMAYQPVASDTETEESLDADDLLGDPVELKESELLQEAGKMRLKVIQPGWGSSGYYSKEMLKRDGPKVFTKGMHMYLNHQTEAEEKARPEGDVENLAGVLTSDARWMDKGPDGPGLYADAEALGPYKEHMKELQPHIGVSIRAFGKAKMGEAEGRKGMLVEELVGGKSVDFVTKAGAGGKILEVLEAARSRVQESAVENKGDNRMTPEETQRLQEAETQAKEANTRLANMETELARFREANQLAAARQHASKVLGGIVMPQATRERLVESVRTFPVKDGQIDFTAFTDQLNEAAKNELAYIEAAAGVKPIHNMGASTAPASTQPFDAAEAEKALQSKFKRMGHTDQFAGVAARGQ